MTKQSELLLLEDVEGLGRSGDIVVSKAGYARNFLMPKGYAVLADNNAKRMQSRLQEERLKKAALDKEQSEAVAKLVNDITVTTEVKVDNEGHMYGSVGTADIAALLEQQGIAVEKRSIKLKHPIKKAGIYDITLNLKEDVDAAFKLKVMPDEASTFVFKEEEDEVPAEETPVVEEAVVSTPIATP